MPKDKEAKTVGRPTSYTEDIGNSFCSELALGNSLRSVCARDDMPSHQTIYNWFTKHPEFLEQYTRAKTDSGDADADRIEEIAEKTLTGEIEPAAARVAIDAYKWTAGKKRPKKYGDKIQTEHSGSVGVYEGLSSDEMARAIAEKQQEYLASQED